MKSYKRKSTMRISMKFMHETHSWACMIFTYWALAHLVPVMQVRRYMTYRVAGWLARFLVAMIIQMWTSLTYGQYFCLFQIFWYNVNTTTDGKIDWWKPLLIVHFIKILFVSNAIQLLCLKALESSNLPTFL